MSQRGDIRNGLADRLATIDGLDAHGYVPRQINPDIALVIGLDQRPGTFGYATYTWLATVRLLTSGDVGQAQERLDTYAAQIEAAIDVDPTLGGAVDDAAWERTRGDSEGIIDVQGVTLYALDVDVRLQG